MQLRGSICLCGKYSVKKERKTIPMLPPAWIMVLLHFRVGSSLYVIPKRALQVLLGFLSHRWRRWLAVFGIAHTAQQSHILDPLRLHPFQFFLKVEVDGCSSQFRLSRSTRSHYQWPTDVKTGSCIKSLPTKGGNEMIDMLEKETLMLDR